MALEKREFLIRGEDGKEYGPAGLEELREWVRENRAGLGSFVRLDESNATWEPWQHYPELVALAAEAQVTGSVAGIAGLSIAPLTRRLLAGILDLILCGILSIPIVFLVFIFSVLKFPSLPEQLNQFQSLQVLLHPQNAVPDSVYFYVEKVVLVVYAVLTLYMIGFHAAHGQTPAKALMRLRVVGRDGGNPSFMRALVRGLLFSLSIYFTGLLFLYVFFNPQRRAIHDYVADTYVVEA